MLRFALAALALALVTPATASAQDEPLFAQRTRKKTRKKTVKKRTTTTKTKTTKTTTRRRRSRRPRKRSTPVIERLLAKGAFAPHIGVNFASLEYDGDPPIDYETTIGVQAGVSYDKAINRFLGYRIGGYYSQRGFELTDEGTSTKTQTTLSYVHVPAQLTARFPASRTVTPFFGIGGYASFLMGVEQLVDNRPQKRDAAGNLVEDTLVDLDYGLVVTGGAFFTITREMMASAELSYTRGFADLIDRDVVKNVPEDFTTETRAWVLAFGVHF